MFEDTTQPDRAGSDALAGARSGQATISVLIAEDDALIRDALLAVLGASADFAVIALAGDADAAIAAALESPPDLALLDVRMPGGGGARAAEEISLRCPATRVVALSAHEDAETIGEMLHAGARGYVTKGTPPAQLLDTLRRCAAGESIFTPPSAASLMGDLVSSARRMEQAKRARSAREERLRAVCDPACIASVFQPIADLSSGEVVMYEALSRFLTEHELTTPEWFEEAVHLDMSEELELVTLTCAMSALRDYDDGSLVVSLNVSPQTLRNPALAVTLAAVDLSRIVIEITEHAQIVDYASTRRAIARMREAGARLAIDDAGAGFASMRHILDLEPDLIKLDMSLVRGIDCDQPRRAFAAGLIGFARETGASIVAEGIETVEELDCVRGLGVQFGQGYALARPAPLPQAVAEEIVV